MRLTHFLLPSLLAGAHAASVPADKQLAERKHGNKCPDVWRTVKADLNTRFMTGNQCNDLARAAIRAIFHDCGTWDTTQGLHGGCDGSLILGKTPDVELDRGENRGLQKIAVVLKDMATLYKTSVADMTVFAGNAAILLCPGGPKVKTFIGRRDSTVSAPKGGLPDVFDTAANLFQLFKRKGYSGEDLAALLGAHSTSTQTFVDPSQANKSQDSTPGQWDVSYYKETIDFAATGKKAPNVFVFPSDTKLSKDPNVGPAFKSFVGNQGRWGSKFAKAMEAMAQFGNDIDTMADCTNALG